MRIGIQAWGSEGDIRPLIALGGGLVQRGHDVELIYTEIAERRYESVAAALGITARAVASPVATSAEMYRIGLLAINARSPLIQAQIIVDHFFKPVQNEMLDAAVGLVDRSDLLIGHFFVHQLRAAAERAGKPEVSVTFAHAMVPSRHIKPAGVPRLGTWVNAVAWGLASFAVNWMWLPEVNRMRQRMGVPPVRDAMRDAWASRLLNLIAVSPALCPPQPDWPASNRVSGFLGLPEAHEPLAPAIEQFLAGGPPPVFLGFGSLMPVDSDYLTDSVVLLRDAARKAGCRAIIQAAVPPEDYNADDVLIVRRAPHVLLFPRCVAVVNHAGAGTTHTVARAGVPSIPIPHLSDQYAWADQLHHLGVAPRGLPRRSLTAARLADRINEAVSSAGLRQRARELQIAMRPDAGVDTAVRLMDEARILK